MVTFRADCGSHFVELVSQAACDHDVRTCIYVRQCYRATESMPTSGDKYDFIGERNHDCVFLLAFFDIS
jgi:hypothetical protein